ncbi:hypothetical protein O9Z70_09385 [Devosia sp. YIM 151766]|uniref:glycine zipper domain-containing protein n=1 Tax=Devosia sp. YIM 151766 TaxID=3017325 RepID=UPI00255C7164|nr:glycine zipper domain-containing protein [Devosia sp. YIM 151766]WIY51702.1 hypothetical protein O9Z70_09385 [Devosia sp. YIM 151766]
MHKILIIAATALSLAACTTTQQGAAVGGIGGAVVGAGLTGGSVVGTAVGAGIGAVAGAAVGDAVRYHDRSRNQCVYRDRHGREFIDICRG